MVTVQTNGRVEFKLLAPNARRVQVVGDFTEWQQQPLELAPSADGWWRLAAAVPAGEHHFRYLVDGWRWMTDFAAFGVKRNKFGQFDSVLVLTSREQPVAQPIAAS